MQQSGDTHTEPAQVIALETRQFLPRHIKGDVHAFAELIGHYKSQVYSYIVRCGVPEGSRDDLFQEVFIKVHKNAASYQPEKPLEPWLYTITCNTVRSYFRKVNLNFLKKKELENTSKSQSTNTGASILEAKETASFILETMSDLPLAQKEALILCCIKRHSLKDASDILGIPINTLKTNLRRARLALARALQQRNETISSEVVS